jgi:predicted amidohydrolase
MPVSIALVQFSIAPSQPLVNLQRMETFVKDAVEKGAQIVVFPEDSVCGPLSGQTDFVTHAPAYLLEFKKMAIKYQVDIVPGSWTANTNGRHYNTTYYVNKDGTVAGTYQKIHLWASEKSRVTPGSKPCVFRTAYGMVGLTICWDVSFPMLFAEMNKLGVQMVISPSYWSLTKKAEAVFETSEDEILLIDSLCTSRAFENNIVFVYCNAAGTLEVDGIKATLSGRSQITHPGEKVVCKSVSNDEEMLIASVELPIQGPPRKRLF